MKSGKSFKRIYYKNMGRGSRQNNVSPTNRIGNESDETSALSENSILEATDLIRNASEKNRSALIWATAAHQGQIRKQTPNSYSGEAVPYVTHTIMVMTLLSQSRGDRDLVCAGVLHDIIEDTDVSYNELREEFGTKVANLVQAVTKDETWKGIRLEDQAEKIHAKCMEVGPDACALKAADLIANLSDLVWSAEKGGQQALKDLFGERKDRWRRKIEHYYRLSDLLSKEINMYPGLQKALEIRKKELSKFL